MPKGSTASRPRLVLVVGTRGTLISDTCAALAAVADVVLASSADLLAGRSDQLGEQLTASAAVITSTTAELPAALGAHARERPVDGVLTFSDDTVELTAAVAADLGLPGQPPHTTANFRDKSVQRSALAAAGLPVPVNIEITAPDQAAAALAAVPLPAILKPTRASGGTLAFVVTERTQLAPLLAEGFREARRMGGAVDRDTAFILESLIVGERWHDLAGLAPYVSVESVAVGGRYVHLGVTDRFPLAPPVLETGMVFPSTLRPDQQQRITQVTTTALRALQFEHGVAHTELMLTADGPVVIEVNARAGGALPYLVPLACGLNLTALAGQVALGELPAVVPRPSRYAVFAAPQHPLGTKVKQVEGIDSVRALPGVRAVIPLALEGSSTESMQHTMIAVVLGTADTAAEAVALHRDVLATVRARYLPVRLPEHYRRTPDGTLAPQPPS
jgi:biotin carboxylase